ncbi:putative bifunctional diguanylate cyclase/phosphodiesterase [Stutzerimonas zhaodongensis]|jgi:diguanylate cyclase (GGDEF)-like protein|uniref:putative bifunctional diguanylate cyclase/phosphodiesterase n=1 Tax=Stutzerimonas zhaodongensis TaxID=1176257 RepID=UPI001F4DBB75|nr:EAL domain-containing protein [Stutzerimonas zhaodongensis]UNG19887.1 EAL domain-containing protein [Stutzerimonas zhaodongensis]
MTRTLSFHARLSWTLAAFLLVVIGALYFSVRLVTEAAVSRQAAERLDSGLRVFERLIDIRSRQLRDGVQVLVADFGFKEAVATGDTLTLQSAMANQAARINASEAMLIGLDGRVLASSLSNAVPGDTFRYAAELRDARGQGPTLLIVVLDQQAHLLVEAEVRAPLPIARVVMGFAMDEALAHELKELTGLDVSFLAKAEGNSEQLATTLKSEAHAELIDGWRRHEHANGIEELTLDGERYLNEDVVLSQGDGYSVIALAHSSLDDALAGFHQLDMRILLITLVGLIASLLGALMLARSLSGPVNALAQAAQRVGRGDYHTPIELDRDDELGSLAKALNQMQRGIAEREQLIAHNMLHDDVTGLPNRSLAAELLSRAVEAGRITAVLHIGIGNLDAVQDSGGSEGVDQALRELTQRLQAGLQPGDHLARMLSDEFLLIVSDTSADNAFSAAVAVQQALALPVRVAELEMRIEAHIGVAGYPDDAGSVDELLRRARIAMQDAAQMPDGLQLYQHGRDDAHQRQISLIRDLRHAANAGGLHLHFQPKVDLEHGRVYQAEALLRWNHPIYGMVSPGEFIPLAERTGSIQLLTAWVIEAVLRQLHIWNGRGLYMEVSLNISAEDLSSLTLEQRVTELLQRYVIPGDQLVFEITESAMMRDPERALTMLHRLRALGIRLSVDDFGTGFSSLAQLRRMPVQELKIDQSFIRELDDTCGDAVIVRSTIDMSHALGLKVVAEGVEHGETRDLLRAWGCDTLQGYFFSRPLPADAFEAWLKQQPHLAARPLKEPS